MKKLVFLVLMIFISVNTPVFASNSFSDVQSQHENYAAIELLAEKGIISGYPDGEFKPSNSITRAEFTAILCRFLGEAETAEKQNGETIFTDVAADHWASGYINYAYSNGIVNGMGDGSFAPMNNVTYEQVLKMVISSFGVTEAEVEVHGGYPNGYLLIANRLDFGNKVEGGIGVLMTRGMVAQVMYNVIMLDDGEPEA